MIYTARVRRSGAWLSIDVPELPGIYGQACRLDRVEELAASGLSACDAAVILGISHQRVSQLVRGESERVAGEC